MYSFTNKFGSSTVSQRIKMINHRPSSVWVWSLYVGWGLLIGLMALACRHKNSDFMVGQTALPNSLPATSPTRAQVVDLEAKGTWYRHLALYNKKHRTEITEGDPVVIQLKSNQFFIPDDYRYESALYINGKAASPEALQQLTPELVSELFVMHQWENLAGIDTEAKPYQIMIQTSAQPVRFNWQRKRFFTLLQAAAISKHPFGDSYSFSMNQLLEATFFHNKNALVERTKDEHLKVYDEFRNSIDIRINNLPATPADVATVHVREVARLYTKELPYNLWFRATDAQPRFELHIQTTPKRAKRDSSYYVFSPFYTGDF